MTRSRRFLAAIAGVPPHGRPGLATWPVLLALLLALVGSGATVTPAEASLPPDFSWSGEAATGNWSNGLNWMGGTAPTSGASIGTLTFPLLNRSACLQAKPSEACYSSGNDLAGLSITAMQVDDGGGSYGYSIGGKGFSLGAGGLTIDASEGSRGQFGIINPLTLGGSQSWSVAGPPAPTAWPAQDVELRSALSGESADLTINLSSLTNLVFGIDVPGAPSVDDEIGNVTINGSKATIGSSSYEYKSRVVIAPTTTLNTSDGHRLTLHQVDLENVGGATGPITAEGSFVGSSGTTGSISASDSSLELAGTTGPITVTDSILGLTGSSLGPVSAVKSTVSPYGTVSLPALSLDAASSLGVAIHIQESESYSQLTSAGTLALGGASLALHISETELCPLPHVGTISTLLSTTGSLSGTFGNAPDGGVVYADCTPAIWGEPDERIERYAAPYRINYHTSGSPQTVTATALPAVPAAYTRQPLPPAIAGPAVEGQTLSESHGSWTNNPTSYAYQWQDCDGAGGNCQSIPGATAQTYTLTGADVGHTIRVQETASNSQGTGPPLVSAATGLVQAAVLAAPGPITGPPSGPGGSVSSPVSLSTGQLQARLAAQLVPKGKSATIAALLRHGGYTLHVTVPEAGTLAVGWYYLPPGAQLAKHRRARPVLIAHGARAFAGAGAGTVKLKLTAQGRRLLRHPKRLTVTAQAMFTPANGTKVEAKAKLTLKRAA